MEIVNPKEITPSVRLRFVGFKKKTKAKIFADLKTDDIIRIEFPFELTNNRYGYAAEVRVVNETQGTSAESYASSVFKTLAVVELTEV